MTKALLDGSMPRQVAEPLRKAGHEVSTVEQVGLKGRKNGDLLRMAEGEFDVLLTADQSIYAQQNLRGRRIAVVALPTNRRRSVFDRAADIAATIREAGPGRCVVVAGDGSRTVRANDDPTGSPVGLSPVPPFSFGEGEG